MSAAAGGHVEALKMLVHAKANIEVKNVSPLAILLCLIYF